MRTATAASAMAVNRETSWKTATMIDWIAAIHSVMRFRRARSQRPGLLVPCSIACGESLSNASTVPRGRREPDLPDPLQGALRVLRARLVVEKAVDNGTGAGDVG